VRPARHQRSPDRREDDEIERKENEGKERAMMKLFERFTVHETHPEVEEHLPELPEGVVVPDDLSGLEVPTRRVTTVRWMRWVPVGIVLAGGGLVLALVLQSDGTTDEVAVQPSSIELVQESIDKALAEAQTGTTAQQPSSIELVQESIDKALAEARGDDTP